MSHAPAHHDAIHTEEEQEPRKSWALLGIALAAQILVVLDISVVNTALPTIGSSLQLAPGLGLIEDVIVDQHFAERGRIGRLLGAVAQNPRILGIGIDENTAIITQGDRKFTVIGEGGVTVLDAGAFTYSNLTDEETDRALSVFDVKLHMLSQGDIFDLRARRPRQQAAEVMEEEILGAR